MVCSHSHRAIVLQGPKRQPGGTTGKLWNRGAPLSKKAKPKEAENDEDEHAGKENESKRETLTSVPLPTSAARVNNTSMASFLFMGGSAHFAAFMALDGSGEVSA